ncbi:MAG: hypothetical protein NXH81_02835 [Halieaceae bacterium]|nr:hypothetical protein [Haliea alexandrii]MCR9184315.1 hypothetical protein [Halieaceae bacterium]
MSSSDDRLGIYDHLLGLRPKKVPFFNLVKLVMTGLPFYAG